MRQELIFSALGTQAEERVDVRDYVDQVVLICHDSERLTTMTGLSIENAIAMARAILERYDH